MFFIGFMGLTAYKLPFFGTKFGKKCIAIQRGMYLGKVNAVGKRQGKAVNLFAANYKSLGFAIVLGNLQGFGKGICGKATRKAGIGASGYDNIGALGQWFVHRYFAVCFAPHNNMVMQGGLFKIPHIIG